MKILFKKHKNRITGILITALAIAMSCVFAACASAQAESVGNDADALIPALPEQVDVIRDDADDTAVTTENYSRWLSDHYSAKVYTRAMWLTDLLDCLDITVYGDDSGAVFSAAYANGILDSAEAEPFSGLTRRYVAQTLVKAFGYEERTADFVSDLSADDRDMSTVTYFGYFAPDEYGMVYPDAVITEEEYKALLDEVRRYELLHGKRAAAFGDSIMFGMGNNGEGIADLIVEKYGMTVADYSVSGATFGTYLQKSHIPDQIKSAAAAQEHPDIILLDGGTNDMVFVSKGATQNGYDVKKANEKTFAGGFEYTAYLLQKYWPDVPVVYVRAHDMDVVDDAKEQEYGDLALQMAAKWGFDSVDIYNQSGLCTELSYLRDSYTLYRDKLGRCDGVHPTAPGYTKYYLPYVAPKVEEVMIRETDAEENLL